MAEHRDRSFRVCYFGTYRRRYSRNVIMIAGLRAQGVEVIECRATLWRGIEDREKTAVGGWLRLGFLWRLARAYLSLLVRFFKVGKFDVMVVGYPGQLDVFLARVLCWLRRKPLVLDVFMSVYLVAVERRLERRGGWSIRLLRQLERRALQVPDLLVQDTAIYVRWLGETHGVAADRFRLVPTGADDRVFRPASQAPAPDDVLTVVYYGTYIPNHGVGAIIDAAEHLRDEPRVRFELIGDGPERAAALARAEELGLNHVEFVSWLESDELVARAAKADILLGAFGTTPQSVMTVQNKVYEGLSMARPVITGDSEAVRADLEPEHDLLVCERASGSALAEAILRLVEDAELRRRLAHQGHQTFEQHFSIERNGARFLGHLREVVARRS